jgi:hypothetical protein
MPVIKNQIGGHVGTLDVSTNASYNAASLSVNTSIETVNSMGIARLLWTGDWEVKQGANLLFKSATGTSGTWEISSQGMILQGSNTVANVTANTTTTNSTLIMVISKYATNNAGVG